MDGFTLERDGAGVGSVYRGGEKVGWYWEDKWGGYAVFLSGQSRPVARLRTEAGCIRRLTKGELTGIPDDHDREEK